MQIVGMLHVGMAAAGYSRAWNPGSYLSTFGPVRPKFIQMLSKSAKISAMGLANIGLTLPVSGRLRRWNWPGFGGKARPGETNAGAMPAEVGPALAEVWGRLRPDPLPPHTHIAKVGLAWAKLGRVLCQMRPGSDQFGAMLAAPRRRSECFGLNQPNLAWSGLLRWVSGQLEGQPVLPAEESKSIHGTGAATTRMELYLKKTFSKCKGGQGRLPDERSVISIETFVFTDTAMIEYGNETWEVGGRLGGHICRARAAWARARRPGGARCGVSLVRARGLVRRACVHRLGAAPRSRWTLCALSEIALLRLCVGVGSAIGRGGVKSWPVAELSRCGHLATWRQEPELARVAPCEFLAPGALGSPECVGATQRRARGLLRPTSPIGPTPTPRCSTRRLASHAADLSHRVHRTAAPGCGLHKGFTSGKS